MMFLNKALRVFFTAIFFLVFMQVAKAQLTLTYPGSPYCTTETDLKSPDPDTLSGTFTIVSPSGGSLNNFSMTTGRFNANNSTPGTYVIRFDSASSGPTVFATLVIESLATTSISYPSTTYCKAAADPSPTITGQSGGSFSVSPATITINTNTGVLDLSTGSATTYTVQYLVTSPLGGCPTQTPTFAVTVTDTPDASFSYGRSSYCQTGSDPSPVFTGNTGNDAFSASAFTMGNSLDINTNNGNIDLSDSDPDIYTVTRTVTTNNCTVTASTAVEVEGSESAAFTYPGSPYCKGTSNPLPTITGVPGGNFSSNPNTLQFVNLNTGQIDLASTPSGTYTITYDSPGACPGSATAMVVINDSTARPDIVQTGICQGQTIPNVTINSAVNTLTWYSAIIPAPMLLNPAPANPNSPTPAELGFDNSVTGSQTVWVTNTVSGCESGFRAVTLDVGNLPAISLTTSSNPACSGENVTFFATGGTSYEFLVNGVTVQNSSNGFFTTNSLANNDTVSVRGTLSGCSNLSNNVIMQINPGTTITLNGNFPLGVSRNSLPLVLDSLITVNPTTGTGVFFSSQGGVSFQNGAYIFDPSSQSFNIGDTVTVVYRHIALNGCVNERDLDFNITSNLVSDTLIRNVMTQVFLRNGDAFCQNADSFLIEINPNSRTPGRSLCGVAVYDGQQGRYLTGLSEDPISPGPAAGQFYFNPTDLQVGTHFMVVFENIPGLGCLNPIFTNFFLGYIQFQIKPVPATPIITDPPLPFCTGAVNDTLFISNFEAGVTYNWTTDPNIGIFQSRTTPFFATGVQTPPAMGFRRIFYANSTLNGCSTGILDSAGITIYPIPDTATVIRPPEYCQNDRIADIIVRGDSGATFFWYDSLGLIRFSTDTTFLPPINSANAPQVQNYFVQQNTFSTPGFAGCTSDTTFFSVRINASPATPTIPLANRVVEICQNAANITPLAALPTGDTLKWWSDRTLTTLLQIGDTLIPNINTSVPGQTAFYVTQTSAEGCQGPADSIVVVINQLPTVTFTGLAPQYCTGDGVQILLGGPTSPYLANPTPPVMSVFQAIDATTSQDVTADAILGNQFRPDSTGAGSFDIKYLFTDLNGCSGTDSQRVVIFPTPTPGFMEAGNCAGDVLSLTDTSKFIVKGSTAADSVVRWLWEYFTFVDSSGSTSSNIIPNAGTVPVTLTVTSNNGCMSSVTRNIFVGSNPKPDFIWTNTCEGGTTDFTGRATDLRSDEIIASWAWNFGSGWLQNFGAISGDTLLTASNTFAPGQYDVMLAVFSGQATNPGAASVCGDTVTHRLYIHPTIKLSPLADSLESFDLSPGGWLAEPANEDSSFTWTWGRPAGNTIKIPASSTSNAWITNLSSTYKPGENSWVNSPCFDFSDLNRPMISMDIWSHTPNGRDGAVLQASVNDGATWAIVGSFDNGVTSGLEWYNQSTISAKPGEQDFGQGWSGEDSMWRTARHKLDAFIGQPSVRFRIAFASDEKHRATGVDSRFDGFAFDNVFIGERKRTLLLEHFTNLNQAASTADLSAAYTLTSQPNNPLDIIPIQYHVAFPNMPGDAYNLLNPDDPEARAFQYGVSTISRAAVNGNEYFNILGINQNTLDLRMLSDPLFTIDSLKAEVVGDSLVASAIITSMKDPYPDEEVFVNFAVIEDSINGGQLQAVMRKLLPDNGGQMFRQGDIWQTGSKDTLRTAWFLDATKFVDQDQLEVVCFVQEKGFNEVYQAETTKEKPDGVRTNTAIEDEKDLKTISMRVYPNPNSGSFRVQLEGKFPSSYTWSVTDMQGRILQRSENTIRSDNFSVQLPQVSKGLYLLHIHGKTRPLGHSKVIVH